MSENKKQKPMLWGLGLDGETPHQYITKGENFHLVGGTQKTHEHMLENVMEFNHLLKKYGKQMEDLSRDEYYKIVEEIGGRRVHWGYFFPHNR